MTFVVGKSVIYDIDQAIPTKSELYSFDNISVGKGFIHISLLLSASGSPVY